MKKGENKKGKEKILNAFKRDKKTSEELKVEKAKRLSKKLYKKSKKSIEKDGTAKKLLKNLGIAESFFKKLDGVISKKIEEIQNQKAKQEQKNSLGRVNL